MQALADRPRRLDRSALAEWVQCDDGDTLFGIEAIARFLALPFLDVRTLIGMQRLPTWTVGRVHTTRRTLLARFWLELEARLVPGWQVAPLPADVGDDDALGLLSGLPAIAAHLGCSYGAVRHARDRNGLGVMWIGKTPFARRASLDQWREGTANETRSRRRLATIHRDRVAAASVGALVGAQAIADYLGRSARAVQMDIWRNRLPVTRVGKAITLDPTRLATVVGKEGGHGIRH